MIFPGVKKIAKSRNWLRSNNMVAGTEKSYMVNMGDGQGYKFFLFSNLAIPVDKIGSIKSEIESLKKKYTFGEINVEDRSVYVTLRELFLPAGRDRIIRSLDGITDILRRNNIPTNDICMECGRETDNALYYINIHSINFNLCGGCVEKLRYEQRQEKKKFLNADSNYLRGLLGAFIFSLPAVVIWMLMAVYLERIGAAVSALIFILSIKGYKKFGGKIDAVYIWIMLGVNIFMIILSNYATVAYVLYMKHNVSPGDIPPMIFSDPGLSEIIYDRIFLSAAICLIMWLWILYMTYKETRFPELVKSKEI